MQPFGLFWNGCGDHNYGTAFYDQEPIDLPHPRSIRIKSLFQSKVNIQEPAAAGGCWKTLSGQETISLFSENRRSLALSQDHSSPSHRFSVRSSSLRVCKFSLCQ